MTTIVIVRKGDTAAIAADSLTTFGDTRLGDILVYEDAYWNVAVAINGGNAAETLSARPGDELRVRLA